MFNLFNIKPLCKEELNSLAPLVLAYVGDAVYEVFVRSFLVNNRNFTVNKLHKKAISFVSAKAQSEITREISEELNDEEKDVLRRGRNAKSGTVAKNANVTDYRLATGFEALIGYLYLKGDFKRLEEIFEKIIYKQDNNKD